MASAGSITLRGRFKPGTVVRLVRVAHEGVLRSEGGEDCGTETVDENGVVSFTNKVEPGARYFLCAYVDGTYLEVRVRGRAKDDDAELLGQAPVQPDRMKFPDGSFADEAPTQETAPKHEVGPGPGQHQVPDNVVQRIAAPRGAAYPVDPDEQAPYRRQEDVPEGVVQASDTETGRASEIVQSVQRQDETPPGLLQRTDTPQGQAYPIPKGNAVQVQLDKDSAAGKESRGEPGRVASEPIAGTVKVSGAGTVSSVPVNPGAPNDRDVVSGHDAMGQPLYADVAANLGLEPAKSPLGDKSIDDARPAKQAEPVSADPPQEAGASETEESTTGAGQPKPSGDHAVTKSTKAKEK